MGAREHGSTGEEGSGHRLLVPVRSFTLIELLLVIGLIGLLMGISFGVYFAFLRTTAMQAETRAVMAVIQAARSTAVAEGAEAFVCVDAEKGQIYPFVARRVGVWHFESLETDLLPHRTYGAFGQVGLVSGTDPATALADGKVGRALLFDGAYHIECKLYTDAGWIEIPAYDAREGVAVEAWIAPVRADGADRMTVVSREGWLRMWLEYDEASGKFALAAEAVMLDAEGAGYMRYSAATLPVIAANEWVHVRASGQKFGTGLALAVRGAAQDLADSAAESLDAAPPSPAETSVGARADGSDPFHGRIDEVLLSAFVVDTPHAVSRKLTLSGTNLAEGNTIRFDASGELAAVHTGSAPAVRLDEYKGNDPVSSTIITVGAMGALNVSAWNKQ